MVSTSVMTATKSMTTSVMTATKSVVNRYMMASHSDAMVSGDMVTVHYVVSATMVTFH